MPNSLSAASLARVRKSPRSRVPSPASAAPTQSRVRPVSGEGSSDDVLWSVYVMLMLGGYEPPVRSVDVWSFGNKPEMLAQLAHLEVCGEKRVTIGWVDAAARHGTPPAYLAT